jgi:aminopeptidase N
MTGRSQTFACTGEVHTFALPGATEHYAPDRPVLLEHIRLEVELDFEEKALAGTCTSRVKAIREIRTVSFDAVELEVRQVKVDGKIAEFSSTGLKLHVTLPSPWKPGTAGEIAIRYRCQPSRGLYFWGPDAAYRQRPVQAWTQGQDEDARAWFPCLDAPAQKATTEMIATFPARMKGLSNGALLSDKQRGAKRTVHYRLDVPHAPYLVTLVVGEFEEAFDKAGSTQLRYLFPPGRKQDALRCVEATPKMLLLFEQLTGEKYPFGSYTQVFVTEFIFGGMENTSATTLTDTVLHDARAHLDFSAEPLVAHELAHQWFGDLITCREWPHAWLNEGFATYCEVLWNENAHGLDEADQQRREELDAYLQEARERYARPIVARKFHLPIDLFDRHLYQKAALVLHDLRTRLGEELFARSIRHYVKKHRGSVVESVDLARAVEEATGHNVDRFLDHYVFSPGHPQLKVEVRYEAEERRVRLKVKQVQKTEGADAAPVYHLFLPVKLVVQGRPREESLEVTDQEHVFYLSAAKDPSQVLVDPRRDVFGTLEVDKPPEYWLEELLRAPEARARTEAAMALGKTPSARALDGLSKGLAKDKFWAVQAACAKALAAVRTPRAREALLENAAVKHPKARRAVVAALGEFKRDQEVASVLRRVSEKGDASYFVEGEAARSLGKLRLEGALPILKKVVRRRSFMEAIAVGAVDGMAESLEPEAFAVVEPLTAYGQPVFIRRAAVVAIAKLAEPAQKKREALDRLRELLRDPQFQVQMAVFPAAQELSDARIIPALESAPFRDGRAQRAARETIRALREDESRTRAISALREEVDRLKEETRGIKERMEAIDAREKKPPRRSRGA